MIVSIHQPNYLPWTTLINKIALSDVFVVFDDVQLIRGKSYVLRTKIKTIGGSKWITIPVENKSSLLNINQIKINDKVNWREKHCNSLKANYGKSKYFSEFYGLFEEAINMKTNNLLELNVEIIKLILNILKVKTKIILSSELEIKETGTEKILGILKAVNAEKFLSGLGKGSNKYTIGKENMYQKEGIDVIYQKFQTSKYPQLFGEFSSDLSIIDMLFNIGKEKTQEIIMLKKYHHKIEYE